MRTLLTFWNIYFWKLCVIERLYSSTKFSGRTWAPQLYQHLHNTLLCLKVQKKIYIYRGILYQDLNPRPSACKTKALTALLHGQQHSLRGFESWLQPRNVIMRCRYSCDDDGLWLCIVAIKTPKPYFSPSFHFSLSPYYIYPIFPYPKTLLNPYSLSPPLIGQCKTPKPYLIKSPNPPRCP